MDGWIKRCPYCMEEIHSDAIKCKHCGEILDETIRAYRNTHNQYQKSWNPGVAAILSLFIPGVGQMYKGNIGSGIVWLILVAVGYLFFVLPGLILHIICIISAATSKPS